MRIGVVCLSFMLFGAVNARAQDAPPLAAAGEDVARFKPIEVEAEGDGPTRQAAIETALANALEQHNGAEIGRLSVNGSVDAAAQSTSDVHTDHSSPGAAPSKSTAAAKDAKPVDLATRDNETLQATGAADAVAKISGGRILSYRVMWVDTQAGGFHVRVDAVLEGAERSEGVADLRRRLSVGAFDSDPAGSAVAGSLHDGLLIDLAQSRRFAVLDRAHDAEYDKEMAIVSGADAPAAERSRAGQMIGADYVLTGKVSLTTPQTTGIAARTTTETMAMTGEVVRTTTPGTLHRSAGAVTVDYELIEIATRQIVLADKIVVPGTAADPVAHQITSAIIAAIYPIRVIKSDDPTAVIISEGGDNVKVGERLKVMLQGTELFDPYTHESLGKMDSQVGVIEVSDVRAKMSYARVVSGQLPASGDLLVQPDQPAAPHALPTVHRREARRDSVANGGADAGGIVLPFDKQ